MRKLPKYNEVTQLDRKIEQYRRIAFSLNDQLTVDRIKTAIAQLQAQKAALHQSKSEAVSGDL
jgi:hypothetical protein